MDKLEDETPNKQFKTNSEGSNVNQEVNTGLKTSGKEQAIEEAKIYYSERGEVQNMSPPNTES